MNNPVDKMAMTGTDTILHEPLPIRVVKVGGSLLSRPELPSQLLHWLDAQQPARNVFLFGGGRLVDALRELDQNHRLDPSWVHWSCIDVLEKTFHVAKSWFPDWNVIESQGGFHHWRDRLAASRRSMVLPRHHIINVKSFYFPDQSGDLPWTWATTTDSIAAFLGKLILADELILLKSCEIPKDHSVAQLAQLGIVDDAFASCVGKLPYRLERLE